MALPPEYLQAIMELAEEGERDESGELTDDAFAAIQHVLDQAEEAEGAPAQESYRGSEDDGPFFPRRLYG